MKFIVLSGPILAFGLSNFTASYASEKTDYNSYFYYNSLKYSEGQGPALLTDLNEIIYNIRNVLDSHIVVQKSNLEAVAL